MLARKKFAYVLVLLWMLLFGGKSALNGQEHDFCTWMKLGMEYEVMPKWTLSSDLEWRTKGDVAEQDRLGWSADVEYVAPSGSIADDVLSLILSLFVDLKTEVFDLLGLSGIAEALGII